MKPSKSTKQLPEDTTRNIDAIFDEDPSDVEQLINRLECEYFQLHGDLCFFFLNFARKEKEILYVSDY